VEPDLDHHVRIVPRVDGLHGLEQLCAALMNEPLSMDRPLWELLIVPGAVFGGVGMVLRIHHATADGMSAVILVRRLLEEDASGGLDHSGQQRQAHRVRHGILGSAARMLVGIRRTIVTLRSSGVSPTVLLGDRSAVHGVEFTSVDLAAVEAYAAAHSATVNDALLSAAAAGYRAVCEHFSEPVPDRLTISVPVALERDGASANRVGVMLVRLPLDELDPARRLAAIARQTRREKPQARLQGTLELMRGPIGARIIDRVGRRQRLVAGFVTNVPGPNVRLRLCGAPLTAIWPVAVLAANVRSGVAAASYRGRLWCGIHFDAAHIPASVFATAMSREFGRMTPAAGGTHGVGRDGSGAVESSAFPLASDVRTGSVGTPSVFSEWESQ
jgi:WS/DGAT/MGAT family acyltransferase